MKRFVCRQTAFVGFFINFAFCYSESATIEIYIDIFAWEELLKADNYSSYDIEDNGFDTGIFRLSFSKNLKSPANISVRGETTIDFKNIRQHSNQDGIFDIFDPSFNYQNNFYGAEIQNYYEGSIHRGHATPGLFPVCIA